MGEDGLSNLTILIAGWIYRKKFVENQPKLRYNYCVEIMILFRR